MRDYFRGGLGCVGACASMGCGGGGVCAVAGEAAWGEELERLAAAMVAELRAGVGAAVACEWGVRSCGCGGGGRGASGGSDRVGEVGAVRETFRAAGLGRLWLACRVTGWRGWRAVAGGVDLILFGPVFEKRVGGEVVVVGVGVGETARRLAWWWRGLRCWRWVGLPGRTRGIVWRLGRRAWQGFGCLVRRRCGNRR